ncbi:MAG TPA: M56 family metallopeptidase [Cellvibrio sp.]|nr:M56 family metallopeptidase [Cellvibrio sp.]
MIGLADLTQMLITTAEWLAVASLKSIPLIAFIFILQRVLRKKLSAAAHYLLWFSVIISLTIPFGWNLQLKPISNTGTSSAETFAASSLSLASIETSAETIPIGMQPPALSSQAASSGIELDIGLLKQHYRLPLAIIWLCGLLLLASITLKRAQYFYRIKRNAGSAPADLLALLEQCKIKLQLKQSIALLSSRDIQSPITLGWLRSAIVLPENIERQFAPEHLQHVLLHELGHIKRQDILCSWTICAINILHWFNPFVWLACRKMRMDMEVACDALVLKHLPPLQHKRYGATLIEISQIPRVSPRVATSLGILENHSELKERLTMIKEFSTMSAKKTAFVAVILMATAITALAQPNLESNSSNATHSATKNKSAAESGTTVKEFAVRAEKDLKIKVLVGQDYANKNIQINISEEPMNYGQVLTQLKINDFTAYKSKDYIQIIPMKDARSVNIPVVEKGKSYFEDEVVTDSIRTEKACVSTVIAAVRPLIPFNGHLTGYEDGRTMVISDTYGNIQRIRNIVKSLEDNLKTPQDCKSMQLPEERPQNKSNK